MFHKEFYPTPEHVLDQMGIDCHNKIVFEPHAGKADIVKYCLKWGAKEVFATEINDDLRHISSKYATITGSDFFSVKAEDISHIDLIVMNPPFSNADTHILHAWNIAPEGCEIISLCNWETIGNDYSRSRKELCTTISDYGEAVNLGDVFAKAERKTGVEIGLVRLFKPKINIKDDMDGFYYDLEEGNFQDGIVRYNEIKAVVNTYTAAVRCFERVESIADELYNLTNTKIKDNDGKSHDLNFGSRLSLSIGYNDIITTKEQFARKFQAKCWSYIFNRVNIEKYVTNGVMKDINKFINSRKNYPFTMKNISKMLDMIIGSRADIMNKAIVEAVDNFTRYTHENRYGVEGWKTNSGYLLNKKFIICGFARYEYSKLRIIGHHSPYEKFIDLIKALCFLTGKDFANIKDIQSASSQKNENGNWIDKKGNITNDIYNTHNYNNFTPSKWYDWEFFEIKVFKKGTAHFKFKDENVWATLNRAYAKIKGQVLPEKI